MMTRSSLANGASLSSITFFARGKSLLRIAISNSAKRTSGASGASSAARPISIPAAVRLLWKKLHVAIESHDL